MSKLIPLAAPPRSAPAGSTATAPDLRSGLINALLSIGPIAALAKRQAREMMIRRAKTLGVDWRQQVAQLQQRDWQSDLAAVETPGLVYPEYYQQSFHAYDAGNLCWEAAWEVEVAAYAVHAKLYPEAGADGDAHLRQSYHDCLLATLRHPPHAILDVGCSIGMSTLALQSVYPQAQLTGLDLSPYFLAVAHHRSQKQSAPIRWVHGAAEATGLPAASFDLVSLCLICHELPQAASQEIFREARRLLRPGGHLAIMDTNPQSPVYAKMPAYIFTLLKSTEPYLDDYFSFDIQGAIVAAGFTQPQLTCNSARHRTLIAQVS